MVHIYTVICSTYRRTYVSADCAIFKMRDILTNYKRIERGEQDADGLFRRDFTQLGRYLGYLFSFR